MALTVLKPKLETLGEGEEAEGMATASRLGGLGVSVGGTAPLALSASDGGGPRGKSSVPLKVINVRAGLKLLTATITEKCL